MLAESAVMAWWERKIRFFSFFFLLERFSFCRFAEKKNRDTGRKLAISWKSKLPSAAATGASYFQKMALVLPSSIMHSGIQNRKQRNAIGPNVIKHQQIVVVVAYMYIPICIPFPPTVLPFPNLKILLRDLLINHQNSETAYVMKRKKKKKRSHNSLKNRNTLNP